LSFGWSRSRVYARRVRVTPCENADKDPKEWLTCLQSSLNGKLFLDSYCLHDCQQWHREFCEAVISCRVFMPLISECGNSSFLKLQKSLPWENVQWDLCLTLELKNLGVVDTVFPVFVGEFVDECSEVKCKDCLHTKTDSSW